MNLIYLPLWKKDATPEERLLEIAMIARKHPERFSKFIVVYQENNDKSSQERYVTYHTNTTEALGLLRLGELTLLKYIGVV